MSDLAYVAGKMLVGPRTSKWGVVLFWLPTTGHGVKVARDWPNVSFVFGHHVLTIGRIQRVTHAHNPDTDPRWCPDCEEL